jgi:MerR family transcriptional regulator, mercuric resistance operon regulatory protein
MPIGELSRLSGVNIETIRYYERIKRLPAPPRTARPPHLRISSAAERRATRRVMSRNGVLARL